MSAINKWVPNAHAFVPDGYDGSHLSAEQVSELKQLKSFLDEGVISREDYQMKISELGLERL